MKFLNLIQELKVLDEDGVPPSDVRESITKIIDFCEAYHALEYDREKRRAEAQMRRFFQSMDAPSEAEFLKEARRVGITFTTEKPPETLTKKRSWKDRLWRFVTAPQ